MKFYNTLKVFINILDFIFRTFIISLFLISVYFSFMIYKWLDDLRVFEINKKDLISIINWQPTQISRIYDSENNLISKIYKTHQYYIPFKDIPKTFVDALISIEDSHFWSHKGVDIKAMLRAAYKNFTKNKYQGASTLTQQLVREVLLYKEKNVHRKIQEIFISYYLEKYISKEKIFEIYANTMYLGNRAYGISAAAKRYFNKKITQLDKHELIVLAGMFQAPSTYDLRKNLKAAKKRQSQVIAAMINNGYLNLDEGKKLFKKSLDYNQNTENFKDLAPYFADYVNIKLNEILGNKDIGLYGDGLNIYSTLNSKFQSILNKVIYNSKDIFEIALKDGKKDDVEIAALVINPKNGHILAMSGGRSYKKSKFNRAISSLRSPGSSFKTIVYSLAIKKGYKWNDITYISPVNIGGYRPYTPKKDFLKEVTLLKAFYKSINTPTVRLAQKLSLDEVIEHGYNLGIKTPLKKEFATALGGSSVSLMDMARVYSVFANLGHYYDLIAIKNIKNHKGIDLYQAPNLEKRKYNSMSKTDSYLMRQGLREVLKRGTAWRARDLYSFAAGKTGTSNNSVDNWFCGFTNNLVAIVWVGSNDHNPLSKSSYGSTLALPIWKRFINEVSKIVEFKSFEKIDNIIVKNIDPIYGNISDEGIPMHFSVDNIPIKRKSNLKYIRNNNNFRNMFSY